MDDQLLRAELESLEIGFMDTFDYCVVHGFINVIGKEPDGDSVRFKPIDQKHLSDITNAYRVKPNKEGSFQLRLENIDAPETHYGRHAQPFGLASRDKLLALIGFNTVKSNKSNPNRITDTSPTEVPATILTKAADLYGRPISYVLVGHSYVSGKWAKIDGKTLRSSINYQMVLTGMAYPLFYNSNPPTHRKLFKAAAIAARKRALGVWKTDATTSFILDNTDSLTASGQLIYPKFFRRCMDYFKARAAGLNKNFVEWLLVTPAENDAIVVNEKYKQRLSDIFEQQQNRISVKIDILDIVVVPK